jgi:hypothetical protein
MRAVAVGRKRNGCLVQTVCSGEWREGYGMPLQINIKHNLCVVMEDFLKYLLSKFCLQSMVCAYVYVE